MSVLGRDRVVAASGSQIMTEQVFNLSHDERIRVPAALLWIAVCVIGIWFTSRVGYSRLIARYASMTGDVSAANKAVELAPMDAHVHRVRAVVLYKEGNAAAAVKELELAASLRPRDDYLWLQLGVIRDELKRPEALLAFNESVRLAPYYAHPQWQRGNFLLRSGSYEQAFVDMRNAAASNRTLVPSLVDLAWGVSRENPELTQRWAGINDDRMRIAFALFLTKHGKAREALQQFRACKVVSYELRRELLQEMITASAFREAFEIWRGIQRDDSGSETSIHDGDFESSSGFDNSGFGWRFSQGSQGARLSLDTNQPQSGSRSLLVNFLGFSDPAAALLSQFVLVEPSRRYRVNFGARTEEIVTGGLPVIVVNDAAGEKKQLGQSAGIESSSWRTLSFDFQSGAKTDAVALRLQRKQCTSAPCPIFGSLWLDNFSIEELK